MPSWELRVEGKLMDDVRQTYCLANITKVVYVYIFF